ncbi:MAG: class I SAM-dependent methyltransferase [Tissierellia bacterium]|nr:class I SAM-dependent methyltransferase [Tissierellia bacterium]
MDHYFKNRISDTLLYPVAGRAYASKNYPQYFHFKDNETILRKLHHLKIELSQTQSFIYGLRHLYSVEESKKFIQKHPMASIVNIGCGLDCLFPEINNGQIKFYNMDLPDVITFRENFYPLAQGEYHLSCNFLDDSFTKMIDFRKEHGVLFLMTGVIHYFPPKDIKKLIHIIGQHYPGAILLFDCKNISAMRKSNREIAKKGIEDLRMKFFIKDPLEIKSWSPMIQEISINYDLDSVLKDRGQLPFGLQMTLMAFKKMKSLYFVKLTFQE